MGEPLSISKDSSMGRWASYYASKGWPVIPLHSQGNGEGSCTCNNEQCKSVAKHPRTKDGLKSATTDQRTIKKWWHKWPDANIGIATGKQSHLVVIDIDPRHGGDLAYQRWRSKYGAFSTAIVATGGYGTHLYFNDSYSDPIRNRVNLEPGIDVRGAGGYVVAPPSVHASGQQYSWLTSPDELAKLPKWLSTMLLTQGPPLPIIHDAKPPQATLIEGVRNTALTSVAGSLKKFGVTKGLTDTLQLINKAICKPPLGIAEVRSIAKSIGKYPTLAPITDWQPPQALSEHQYLLSVMDESYLPYALKACSSDICKRMQVPIEFVAIPAIVAISGLIGRSVAIYPKQNDNWLVIPNLWGGIIARPGFFKSPAMAEALKPLENIIAKENIRFEQEQKTWEAEREINQAMVSGLQDQLIKAVKKNNDQDIDLYREKLKTLKHSIEEGKPKHQRYKTNDVTVEKLAQILMQNPAGILVVRDELFGWIASLRKSGREGDREFYLESWNGYGSFTVDRVGRGTIHVPALCLSVLGGIQPDKLSKYLCTVNSSADDDGLLQRFQLLIYPDLPKKWKNYDISPDAVAQDTVNKLFEDLNRLRQILESGEQKRLRFAADAQVRFDKWRSDLELLLRSGRIKNSAYESHLAKFRSLVPSLALIFHVLQSEHEDQTSISNENVELAIKWPSFLDLHARKIYQVESEEYMESARALASKISEGRVKDGDSIRSVYRHHWTSLSNKDQLNGAISILGNLHWLKIESVQSGSSKVQVIRLNPSINDMFQSEVLL